MKRRWLQDWPWETVVTINAGLCKEKNALHKPTSKGHEPARKLWEKSRTRELTLRVVGHDIAGTAGAEELAKALDELS